MTDKTLLPDTVAEPKPTTQVLLSAAFALTPPENWIKGSWATDASGTPTGLFSPEASCWCVLGAIRESAKALYGPRYCEHFSDAVIAFRAVLKTEPHRFNDWRGRKHSEVIQKLYEAAARSESKR